MQNLPRQIRRQSASQDRPPPAWTLLTGLAVAGAYFFAARLSLALLTKSDGVAVFWPAAGVIFALCIAGEAFLVARLIKRQFGEDFRLESLPSVFGLFAAAGVGPML